MCLPPFEKESLHDEYWSLWQQIKLPSDLELSVDNQIKQDIWEYQNQTEQPIFSLKMLIKKLFLKKGTLDRQRKTGGFRPHLK